MGVVVMCGCSGDVGSVVMWDGSGNVGCSGDVGV